MDFEELKNPELLEKLKSAKTSEELVSIAREQGIELTDEQLETVSGGIEWTCQDFTCDKCKSF